MSCEVAELPFQAHANYGTWSIDFENRRTVLILLALYINIHTKHLSAFFKNVSSSISHLKLRDSGTPRF